MTASDHLAAALCNALVSAGSDERRQLSEAFASFRDKYSRSYRTCRRSPMLAKLFDAISDGVDD